MEMLRWGTLRPTCNDPNTESIFCILICRKRLDAIVSFVTPMARSNSPTRGHPKVPQAGRSDYDDSGLMAMREAASLRR